MNKTTFKNLIFLSLTTYLLLGCVKQDKVSSNIAMETTTIINDVNIVSTNYGKHTDQIEKFLSATPLGAEIYLEEKEDGEWYIKIEKTFTAKKNEEKTEIIQPIYGESILI